VPFDLITVSALRCSEVNIQRNEREEGETKGGRRA